MPRLRYLKNLPIEKNEDVEFSYELADEADKEAIQRAKAADLRAGKRPL